jgi:hypothetical protein
VRGPWALDGSSVGAHVIKNDAHGASAQLGSRQLWKPSRSWLDVPTQLCQQTDWHSGMKVDTVPARAGAPSCATNA